MRWNEEERQRILLGMETILWGNDDEAEAVVKGLFDVIVSRSYSIPERARVKMIERTFPGESHPVYPDLVQGGELARELHVRLRDMYGREAVPINEFKAVINWHRDVCACKVDWMWTL